MGERIKIDDLARLMISERGLRVRSADNPKGDIEIEYVGLVPGEKMHEELQLGNNPTTTEHAKILRTREPSLNSGAN